MKYIHIYLLALIALLSCSKTEYDDWGGNSNVDPNPEESIIKASNPFPCINEEITLSYSVQGESTAVWTVDGEIISDKKEIKLTYDQNGTHPVKVKITNDRGAIIESSINIQVMGEKLPVELTKLVQSNKFWICAHRANTHKGLTNGANMAPENSLKAIETAIKQKVQMIEIDIRITFDKEFVIMHDKSVNRTTNGTGNVSALSLLQIKSLSLKDNAGNVTEHKVPTLKEALESGRGKIYYNIDLGAMLSDGWTAEDTKRLVKMIEDTYMMDRVVFYIARNQAVGNDFISANKNSLLFPWISSTGDLSNWSVAKLVQLAPDTESSLINAALVKGVPSFSNHLEQDDLDMLNGDYSKLDNLVNKKIKIIQTDYAELVNEYVN
ncbi:glycerophosphoryl diester phosphodiesterase [Dysgonomonas hofstadii]|uniref:Glycerophosphoryl diester phosphodiesterase n=1 Tax=Dysgonomonas hofstadii TaxID=637886 RepID=A0A840CUZ9_9BACT|nr:glycerophosphodiester phosphodiesterase family protein [Dysgonomonas hofstadii]MBB4036302.1 glycerophosphoryl diester phosphodiesterase [Dysgonomonas hofstadii]